MNNMRNKILMTLALLIAAVGGAWAQTETLLTTITATGTEQASYSTANVATVSFSYTAYGSSAYKDGWGWWGYGWIATVTAAEGYTITKCIFYDDANRTATDSEAPFVVETTEDDKTPRINGTPIDGGNMWSKGINKIEVYGYKSEPAELELTPDETGKTWTLAKMPASNIELQVEYEPTKVTMAANDNAMGTVEVAGQTKVEWTADTWKGWNYDTKEYTVGDITMTSSKKAYIRESTEEGKYKNSLSFGVIYSSDESTVTFSTTGDPFSRIEFTMIDDYSESNPNNPHILPLDNWTFSGKSAVWEGEATKSLTLQSCSTNVSKITFYKGFAIPDGVTINGDGTFTVAKAATVTLKATPAEGYKFLYWEDDQNNTNPVREVTIESGMADKTYKAVFAEILYNVTFVEGTNLDEWSATPNTEVKKDAKVDIKYTGTKKVIGVKVEKKEATPAIDYSTAQLGDLFYSDGTFSTELEAGKTPIGVIAYLDKEGTDDDEICEKSNGAGHGLVLCLKNAASGAAWSTDEVSKFSGQEVNDAAGLKRTTNVSGYSATAALATDATTYPAAAAAKNYTGLTAPTSTTGWFLPSAQQWVKMQTGLGALEESSIKWNSWFDNNHEGADRWEAALSKAGSGNYDSMTSEYLSYWSSSEYLSAAAVRLSVDATDLGEDYGFSWNFSYKGYKENDHRVRPVLAF